MIGHQHSADLLIQAIFLNNDIIEDKDKNYIGDSTEKALKELVRDHKIKVVELPRVGEIAFDADRKLMTTFHPYNNHFISFTKGAPDLLIKKLNQVI